MLNKSRKHKGLQELLQYKGEYSLLTTDEVLDMYVDEDLDILDEELIILVNGVETTGKIFKTFTIREKIYTCLKTDDGEFIFFTTEDITKDVTVVTRDYLRSEILSEVIELRNIQKESHKREVRFVLILAILTIIITSYCCFKSSEKFISFDDYGVNYERADLIYNKVDDSVVLLRVYNRDETEYGTSSGLIVSDDGYIVSCAHIYDDIANPIFKVVTNTGKTYQAAFVAGDIEADVCLLKIIKTEDKFTPVKFTNSSLVNAGDSAYILGFPGGGTVEPVITAGIVSHPDVRITAKNGYEIGCIQTDTTANPGHSGGGLFDSMGHVIGLVSAKYVSNTYENTIYCIPSATIEKVVNSLYYNGYIARPTFGITFQNVSNVEMDNGIPYGGKLVAIDATSSLYGLVEVGEVITAINGSDITLAYDFYDAIQNITTQNPQVTLKIYNIEKKEYRNVEFIVTFRIGESGYKVGNFETIVPEEKPSETPDSTSPEGDNSSENK